MSRSAGRCRVWWRSPPGPPDHLPRLSPPRLALEDLAHQVDDLWVIVGHQEAAALRNTRQCSQDGLPVKGFEQIVEGPELITRALLSTIESTRMGMSRVVASVFSSCRSCQPSLCGMRMSSVMANGRRARAWTFLATRSPDHTIARLGEVLAQEVDDIWSSSMARMILSGSGGLILSSREGVWWQRV